MSATTSITEIPTAWIPLPDGTRLAARIWLPEGAEARPAPAVLEFLPYRRRDVTAPRDESTYPALAAMGIAGVRVDMRGTGDSDGIFDDEYSPRELADAEAAIAWIAAQPWCSGKVGMMGISWGGFNALQVAARRPPALKAVISIASTVDRFADDIHYKGGCHLSAQLYWATTMLGNIARPPDSAVVGADWRAMWLARLERIEPLIFPWLSRQRRDGYWRHGSICEDFGAVEAPALVIAGWADGYRNAPHEALAGLGHRARSVTGPWIHKYPHFAFPHPRLDFHAEARRWFGRWLMDEATGAEDLPPHRLYRLEGVRPGGRRDRDPGRWIAIGSGGPEHGTRLHLLASGRLDALPGEPGTATIRTPLDCGTGGGEYFTGNRGADLPDDQRADDGMSLCFETAPLPVPLDVIGRPVLRLPVAADAPVANLVARLVDVHPDGTAHRVSIGLLNLCHRHGSAAPQPMTPGVAETVEIRLDSTAYRFLPGHRLRLALSSAYFPLILPPPTDATLTATLGAEAVIDLPCPEWREIDLPEPADPAPLPAYPSKGAGAETRRVTRNRPDGRTTVTVEADTGELRHPANGMEWREQRLSEWSLTGGEPLSVEGRERMTALRRRDGTETIGTATGRLTATATHWVVEAGLDVTEDGRNVFSRRWSGRIPRDHM
ncbi:CocE/NonD family hydrolase [Limibaculum sp. FT325]|uniref:CocE/NonD family hydrolase n=1 Tax=Thermohalobaculum sediminis TaxID=2939436 RepID=UPI0020C0A5BD|nr:CocE/NonD family hydrolase [Limibaculum sediminis]MCL5775435.1 CocE/NonD family hydrolase [Limibaculum sediminis]